ncbi:hypothetical protein [Bradyrhizobium hipponense]|uniref:hypothetical protein n=1 Tax=Bradyrhizobium hipponense TaxID=2605638 RepID=UPI00165308AF
MLFVFSSGSDALRGGIRSPMDSGPARLRTHPGMTARRRRRDATSSNVVDADIRARAQNACRHTLLEAELPSVCRPSETDGSLLLLPQIILRMPVTGIIVSHLLSIALKIRSMGRLKLCQRDGSVAVGVHKRKHHAVDPSQ